MDRSKKKRIEKIGRKGKATRIPAGFTTCSPKAAHGELFSAFRVPASFFFFFFSTSRHISLVAAQKQQREEDRGSQKRPRQQQHHQQQESDAGVEPMYAVHLTNEERRRSEVAVQVLLQGIVKIIAAILILT